MEDSIDFWANSVFLRSCMSIEFRSNPEPTGSLFMIGRDPISRLEMLMMFAELDLGEIVSGASNACAELTCFEGRFCV